MVVHILEVGMNVISIPEERHYLKTNYDSHFFIALI